MKTARERIAALAALCAQFPELGFHGPAEVSRFFAQELRHVDALDRWIQQDGKRTKAIAAREIYHVGAANLPVSLWHSVFCGLLLGSRNVVKPAAGQESQCRNFVRALPVALRRLVKIERRYSRKSLEHAEAVIVFGSDETVASFQGLCRPGQLFLGHGHKVSLLWLGAGIRWTPAMARACAYDVSVYDQAGCLSPQVIYCSSGLKPKQVATDVAKWMDYWHRRLRLPRRTPEESARVMEGRDMAHALGEQVWGSVGRTDWTVVGCSLPGFRPTCAHRFVEVRPARENTLAAHLSSVRGNLSTVGLAGELSEKAARIFAELGASRICAVGRMQHPRPGWHHDGQPTLSRLVRWIDREE